MFESIQQVFIEHPFAATLGLILLGAAAWSMCANWNNPKEKSESSSSSTSTSTSASKSTTSSSSSTTGSASTSSENDQK